MPEKEMHEIAGEREGATAAPATKVGAATRTKPEPARLDRLPPFKVLLHNDDVNDMLDVVTAIVELTPLRKDDAVQRMLEAHAQGVALLLTTHKERAELYRDQFLSKNLTVSIEPGG